MDFERPTARDLEDACSLQQDLLDIFSTAPERGVTDAERMDEVRRICLIARLTVDDRSCHAFLQQVERYAECFFLIEDRICWEWHSSPERYQRLRRMLLRLVNAFGIRMAWLELHRRSHQVGRESGSTRRDLRLARRNLFRRPAAAERIEMPTPAEETPRGLPDSRH